MPAAIARPSALKLSICITTLNRAAFIGATLDSILGQLTNDCEVVVLDAASTDDTERVVAEHTRRFEHLRYVRQETNAGVDRDYDRAVQLARGEYCWLMTDDDLLKPGAIVTVLQALQRDIDLIVVNVESRDLSVSKVLQRRWLSFESDRVYETTEMDRLFVETDDMLAYIGCIVIKRTIWLARERERYYGSLFIHVGVIFQRPLPGRALVIAEPLIIYRMSNAHTWSSKMIDILFVKWPSLVGSLDLPAAAKRRIWNAEPWGNPRWLLLLRGWGFYSLTEYQQWIRPRLHSTHQTLIPTLVALLPGVLVNAFFLFYYSGRQDRGRWLQAMKQSRLHVRNWRIFTRKS